MGGIGLELHDLARRQLRTRIEGSCVLAAAAAVLSLASDLDHSGPEFRAIFGAVWAALSALTIGFVCRLAALAVAECPRCAQTFFQAPWAPLVFARRCAHCELALPRAGSAGPPAPTA